MSSSSLTNSSCRVCGATKNISSGFCIVGRGHRKDCKKTCPKYGKCVCKKISINAAGIETWTDKDINEKQRALVDQVGYPRTTNSSKQTTKAMAWDAFAEDVVNHTSRNLEQAKNTISYLNRKLREEDKLGAIAAAEARSVRARAANGNMFDAVAHSQAMERCAAVFEKYGGNMEDTIRDEGFSNFLERWAMTHSTTPSGIISMLNDEHANPNTPYRHVVDGHFGCVSDKVRNYLQTRASTGHVVTGMEALRKSIFSYSRYSKTFPIKLTFFFVYLILFRWWIDSYIKYKKGMSRRWTCCYNCLPVTFDPRLFYTSPRVLRNGGWCRLY